MRFYTCMLNRERRVKVRGEARPRTSIILGNSVISLLCKGDVSKMEDSCHNAEHICLCLTDDTHDLHCMLQSTANTQTLKIQARGWTVICVGLTLEGYHTH